jgi:hypothetical protein
MNFFKGGAFSDDAGFDMRKYTQNARFKQGKSLDRQGSDESYGGIDEIEQPRRDNGIAEIFSHLEISP